MMYSAVLVCATYVVPLIVFPYVSRVLRPENFGLVNFIDSTVDYFIILSMLGMNILGIREIAACRDNRKAVSRTFSSLLTLNMITTGIVCVLLEGAYLIVPELREAPQLMAIGALKLIFNCFLIEWLYKGLERFRYISLRAVSVKLLFVAGVFVCVKSIDDYTQYYALFVGAIIVNALINIFHSRRFVTFSLRRLELRKFIKPFAVIGCYSVLTAMYTTFNAVYLGIAVNESQVAYYVTAVKVCGIILVLFTIISDVMMPRLSARLARGERKEFCRDIRINFSLLIAFAMPAVCFGCIMAPEIVRALCGEGYEGAVMPLRIAFPLVLVIGAEQIMVYQSLVPMKRDRTIFFNALIAALLAIILNLMLVGTWGAVGSAVVWVACEVAVFVLSQRAVWRSGIRFPFVTALREALMYAPLGFLLWKITGFVENPYFSLTFAVILTLVYCGALHAIMRRSSVLVAAWRNLSEA